MNILVTGGAGFVGTNLIKRLVSEGHSVVSIDNYNSGFESNHVDGATYIEKDIINVSNFAHYGDFDLVYHLAAIARIQPSFKQPVEYFETNSLGTMYVVNYCRDYKIPLVYAGSSSHHSGKFKNPYTFSKDIGEEIVNLYQTHFELQASITRFYNVYGPHHLKEGGYCTLIGKWENLIEKGLPLEVYGDGEKRRDFTHINDIVDALILIGQKQAWGHIFELGRGKNYSINDIAEMFGKVKIHLGEKPGEAQVTLCDSTLAKDVLGWVPKINIEDYIKEYLTK
jgi:UDP-glucose 4-epimerase